MQVPVKGNARCTEAAKVEVTFSSDIFEYDNDDVEPFRIIEYCGGSILMYGQGGDACCSERVASVIPFEAGNLSRQISSKRPARTILADASFVMTVVGLLTKMEKFTNDDVDDDAE